MSEPTTIDQRFELILQSLGKIDARLENLEAGQARHEELLTKLVASQEKQDKILEKQDHILELLTLRSMDQQAEINMIKEAI